MGNTTKEELLNALEVTQREKRWELGPWGGHADNEPDEARPGRRAALTLIYPGAPRLPGGGEGARQELAWFPSVGAAERKAEETTGMV